MNGKAVAAVRERSWRRVENSTEQAEKHERIKYRERHLKPQSWEEGLESSPCCFCASSLMHPFLKFPLSFALPAGFFVLQFSLLAAAGPSPTWWLQGHLEGSGWPGAALYLPAVLVQLGCAAPAPEMGLVSLVPGPFSR